MNHDPTRHTARVPFSARAVVRGAMAAYDAAAEDISRTGIRLAVLRDVLGLAPNADLAAAAALVQTRIGSRFQLDLGLSAAGHGRVRKVVELVRLVLDGPGSDWIGLGCTFVEPLTASEASSLNLQLPDDDEAAVRQTGRFADGGRASLDPRLGAEKVDRLFDVPAATATSDRTPDRELGALLRPSGGASGEPLVGQVADLTEASVRLAVPDALREAWGGGGGCVPDVATQLHARFGDWPELELLDARQRLWHGPVRLAGLELGPDGSLMLRFVFSRRLPPVLLERLCA
ncbi:MAG: hypothetical protein O2894_00540 [Planctomycetota bacterium]|nr:hypothetical protein [Planctomycetota bacterium]